MSNRDTPHGSPQAPFSRATCGARDQDGAALQATSLRGLQQPSLRARMLHAAKILTTFVIVALGLFFLSLIFLSARAAGAARTSS